MRGSVPSGRTKILDIIPLASQSVTALALSCGGSDPEWEIYIDRDISELDLMGALTLQAAATGGLFLRSKRVYARVTTVDANGIEGPPSMGVKSVTTGSLTDTNKVTVTWASVVGASSYNVYIGSRPGMETFVSNVIAPLLVVTDFVTPESTQSIPTTCDMNIISKKLGVEPIAPNGLIINSRLIVYINVNVASDPAFVMMVG